MIRSRLPIVLGLLFVLSIAGFAPVQAVDIGVAARGGTQGLGAEVGIGFTEWLTIRGGYYAASISESFDEGGIDYDGDLDVGGSGVIADFFPFRGTFRVSAGLFSNDNEIQLVSTPTVDVEIGGIIYTPAEVGVLNGLVAFDDTAPYLGIGWGNIAKGKRFGFMADIGVLKQGSGEVSLVSTGIAVDPMDLAAEAAEIEADISDYDLWPVLSLGVAFRF